MKVTFRQKMAYKFERFLNKGGSSIFKSLLVLFLIGFSVILIIRFLILLFFPDMQYLEDFGDHIWTTFLQMTSPGQMSRDTTSPIWFKITTILAGFTGVIIVSMLIAFITSSINSLLYNFRKARGKVIESDHTIILGWNDRVVDIIRELILANESEKRGVVVILAEAEKEMMEDLIAKRLPDTITTEIIITSGNPSNISELNRVNVTSAKSVIVMAKCSENAPEEDKINSDVQAIKSIMAIQACQNFVSSTPIISEVFTEEKRKIIEYFDDENLIALDTWTIMGKLMMQTSLTSGLQLVYNEMLSFDGGEVYFYEADWGKITFTNLALHFEDGIPLGIYNEEEGLVLRPPDERIMKPGDEVIIFAEDDSTIEYSPAAKYSVKDIPLSDKRLDKIEKKTLIMGWHSVAEIIIHEAEEYLLENSRFDIMYHKPHDNLKENLKRLQVEYPGLKINLIDKNPMIRSELESVNPAQYDNLLILSQHAQVDNADKVDSDTLIILLLLRAMVPSENGPKIMTQVLNSENQELINQTAVDDFIISNRLITMVLAQLSEEPKIKMFYDDIFSEDGSEIYIKPANLYFTTFPQKITFADAIGIAQKREEVCLGIRKGHLLKEMDQNFGVRLNLPKDEMIEINENDFLVVLSEDEL